MAPLPRRTVRAATLVLAALTLGSSIRAEEPHWEFTAQANLYVVPDDEDYVQPTVTADRGALHLEARYNYEGQDTTSLWAGYNFEAGEKVAFAITPMLGGVFGDTDGIAPGFRTSLDWRWLTLYSEAEYLFDSGSQDDSFFYAWSEATLSPVDWFRFGLVGQRTRAYASSRDIQRGLLVGFQWEHVGITAHAFNIDDDETLYVGSVSLEF